MHEETGTGWPEGQEPSGTEPGAGAERGEHAGPAEHAEPAEPAAGSETRADSGTGAADGPDAPEPVVVAPARPSSGRRLTAAGAVIGLLLGLLGFALVVQLKSNDSDSQLETARPEDLVRILSDLEAREERLRQEIAELEGTGRQLASGAEGRAAALDEARRRADELGVLAGTLPAQGTGLVVTFQPGSKPVRALAILDAVEELRGAGAEAMQISGRDGEAVRIVASTAFVDSDGGLLTGGQRLLAPYTITVIGDPQTMRTALNIPGGVVESVEKDGGTVTVHDPGRVDVDALHRQADLRYARPAS